MSENKDPFLGLWAHDHPVAHRIVSVVILYLVLILMVPVIRSWQEKRKEPVVWLWACDYPVTCHVLLVTLVIWHKHPSITSQQVYTQMFCLSEVWTHMAAVAWEQALQELDRDQSPAYKGFFGQIVCNSKNAEWGDVTCSLIALSRLPNRCCTEFGQWMALLTFHSWASFGSCLMQCSCDSLLGFNYVWKPAIAKWLLQ